MIKLSLSHGTALYLIFVIYVAPPRKGKQQVGRLGCQAMKKNHPSSLRGWSLIKVCDNCQEETRIEPKKRAKVRQISQRVSQSRCSTQKYRVKPLIRVNIIVGRFIICNRLGLSCRKISLNYRMMGSHFCLSKFHTFLLVLFTRANRTK